MIVAVLHAEGMAADLETLAAALAEATGGGCEIAYRPRSTGATGGSGFSVCVSDADDRATLIRDVRNFLRACRDHAVPFQSLYLVTVLDIGVTVGIEDPFAVSIEFSPEDLALFAEVGLAVRVSAYPASDSTTERSSS